MAHPVVWPKKHFFYPIGNTPPVCLTQDLPPEASAEVLLLGSGDPRCVLFTVFQDLMIRRERVPEDYRTLDVTCCDWEPAVLARNIILLTMAADGMPTRTAWSIFYHLFLTQPEHTALLAHCRTLVQCASDWAAWQASAYGAYIRFCTEHAFAEVRRHWELYLASGSASDAEASVLRETVLEGMKAVRGTWKENEVLSCVRSAGPLVVSFVREAAKSHNAFWTTGTAAAAGAGALPPQANPTFLHSLSGKDKLAVHYGTDPLAAFHLAPALVPVQGASAPPHQGADILLQHVVGAAMSQFDAWCAAFRKRVAAGSKANLAIRFHVGEAMAFCRALLVCQRSGSARSGVYTAQWGASQIVLDESEYSYSGGRRRAPVHFNVIDTSNLTDHLGLFNVLSVTAPLLQQHSPSAVLHTDTLVPLDISRARARSETSTSNLAARALSDIPTLAMVLGLAPAACRAHFTTLSNKHEILASPITYGQMSEHIAWKIPAAVIPGSKDAEPLAGHDLELAWRAKDLARFFFAVYLKMFADEDVVSAFGSMTRKDLSSRSLPHYTRESFVAFLALAKERVQADWDEVMGAFDNLLVADRTLLVGSNNYQDMVCHLYLRGVYVMYSMTPAFLNKLRGRNTLFRGWRDIPPAICVVITVPRRRLRVLEEMDANEIMTPLLQCETRGAQLQFHNIHSSILPAFGRVVRSSTAEGETSAAIDEDPRGWDGDADLVVSFYMPTWIVLQHAPGSVEVALSVKSTPMAIGTLGSKLGMLLNIYSTKASNAENVLFVRHRPDNLEEIKHLQARPLSAAPVHGDRKKVVVNFDASEARVSTLTVREDISDPAAKRNLLQGASVGATAVADSVLRVNIQDYATMLVYPFPIMTNQTKVRIARKSSYIEIEAPVRPNFEDPHNPSLNLFPAARDGKTLSLLNIHYLNLDKLPALQLPNGVDMESNWLSVHLGMAISDREKQVGRSLTQEQRGMLFNLKESIGAFFMKHVETDDRPRVFGLHNPGDDVGIYTLIFLNDIRLDLSAQTVVADACVVPLYKAIMPRILDALRGLSPIAVVTLDDETLAWKRLLPALAERCRTWMHTDKCEYLKNGFPAALDGYTASPLCSCGKGKNLGPFAKVASWKAFQPEATRVAISPLFTFSTMYGVLESLRKSGSTEKSSGRTAQASASSSSSTLMNCANCDKSQAPHVCSRCMTARYCSSSCQKNHWKAHKPKCVSKT